MPYLLTAFPDPGVPGSPPGSTASWGTNNITAGIVRILFPNPVISSGGSSVSGLLNEPALDGSHVLISVIGINPGGSGLTGLVYRWDGLGGLEIQSSTNAAADVQLTVVILGSL